MRPISRCCSPGASAGGTGHSGEKLSSGYPFDSAKTVWDALWGRTPISVYTGVGGADTRVCRVETRLDALPPMEYWITLDVGEKSLQFPVIA